MKEPKLISISFDKFKRRKLSYLFWPFFPRQQLTLLMGEGEMGKTTLTTFMATCVTQGLDWPIIGGQQLAKAAKGSVIILCKEEVAATVTAPRLFDAGANLKHVHTIGTLSGLEVDDFEVIEALDQNLAELEKRVDAIGDVQLIVLDPITEFAGESSIYNEVHIRNWLTPIIRMCARRNIALVGIIHTVKDTKRTAKNRMMGGAGLFNIARSIVALGKSKDDTRYLMTIKANHQKEKRHAAFNIVSGESGGAEIEWHPDWEENVDVEAILAGKDGSTSKFSMAKSMVESWLAGGAVPAAEIEDRIKSALVGRTTINKAKEDLGVISVKPNGVWHWALPGKEEPRVEDGSGDEITETPETGGRASDASRNGGRAKARDIVARGGRPKAGRLN